MDILPNEITIGNLFKLKNTEQGCFIIGAISEENIKLSPFFLFDKSISPIITDYEYSALQPIELTDEWLVNFGFKIEYKQREEFYLSPLILLKEDIGLYMRQSNDYVNKNPIKYVHQLQNFYFQLTGRSLKLR